MYFLRKMEIWFHGRENDYKAIPLRVIWICSPSLRKSCTAAVVGVRHPNQALPSWGRLVTVATMASETSIHNPQTSEWVSVRFKVNCKAASRWNPFMRWKNSDQPAAWKMVKKSAFLLSSCVFGGSYRAGIPMFFDFRSMLQCVGVHTLMVLNYGNSVVFVEACKRSCDSK